MDQGSRRPSSDPALTDFTEEILDPRSHLAAIVDSSDDPIISKDLTGRIMSWNPAAERLFGYSSAEMVGAAITRIIPPELHLEEEEMLARLSRGERIEPFETTRVRKDGSRIPVSVTISPVRNGSGQVVGASKIVRDVSLRQQNEESRFRLSAIVDSAEDAIISKDLRGIVRTWNEGARRTFGYTAEEMVGQSILKVIPPHLQHEEDTILAKIRAGERIEHYETVRVRKNGQQMQVSVTISPIRDQTGRIIGASKIARDISDRKRMERLLIDTEKLAANGRMAAAIAHEINNPLESLMNLIYLARQNSAGDSKTYQYLVTAEEELERVSHIARQTLGYYRDTGKPEALFVHDLLQNVLTVYQSKLITNNVKTDARFEDNKKIVVRKGEMMQVFSNVLANAVDAMSKGGRLTVYAGIVARPEGEGVEVTLQDTGGGIPANELERVFDPFFTTKGDVGTGVGLWVARQLVGKRGGDILITSSTTPGASGTEVKIFLPFEAPTNVQPQIR
ncbi:MAG TPA: PAS domain S-box protein [Acidobacteriaceae bacterium]|nr:PAS domain S-box protein [Acidobacteriaceae bacterium]